MWRAAALPILLFANATLGEGLARIATALAPPAVRRSEPEAVFAIIAWGFVGSAVLTALGVVRLARRAEALHA